MNIKITNKDGITLKTKGTYIREDISVAVDESILGATITTKGGWQGTPVPNEGLVEKIYFNTELSIDEVNNLLSQLEYNFGEMQYFCISDEQMENCITFYSMNGSYAICGSVGNLFFSDSTIAEQLGENFVGWNPNIAYPLNINIEAISSVEWEGETMSIGSQNNLLSSLFSITPFVQSTGEEVLLEGNYDGSSVEIDELGGLSCTPVPEDGHIDKIYFNMNLSKEEMLEIFETLNFVDYMENIKVWSCFVDDTMTSEAVNVYKINENGTIIYHVSVRKDGQDYAYVLGGDISLYAISEEGNILTYSDNDGDGWLDAFNGIVEFNMDNSLTELAPMLSFTPNNELAKKLFSSTPFKELEPNTIDMESYIAQKKIPLEIKVNVGEGIDTSDATATANDILQGVTAYVNGNKITGRIVSRTSSDVSFSANQTIVSPGYYSSAITKQVPSGSATTPTTTITAQPSISVNSSGTISAQVSSSKSITPTVSAGYVSAGTAGTVSASGYATLQLTTMGANSYTPSTSDKTISSGVYLTGVQTIKGDSNLTAANIKSGTTIFGVTGTYTGTYTDTEVLNALKAI